MFLTCIIVLISFFSKAESGWCEDKFKWMGQTTPAIGDCEILKTEMSVQLRLITNKPDCLSQVRVASYNEQQNQPGELWAYLGTPGNKSSVEIPNPIPKADRCKAISVRISAVVHQNGSPKMLRTTFSLNPNSCITAVDVSFARMCSEGENSIATSTITSVVNNNRTHPLNRRAADGLSGKT